METEGRVFPKWSTNFFSKSMFSLYFSSKHQHNSHQERTEQKSTIRNWNVVVEVGVKTHTATCQTHICDLARLMWHNAPAEEEKNQNRQTKLPAACASFSISIRRLRDEISGFFASLNEEGLFFFFMWRWAWRECWSTRRHACASVQCLWETGQ